MQLIQATPEHLEAAAALMERVKDALTAEGIFQWDERYPNRDFIHEAINDGNLYVFLADGVMVGSVVLDEWQVPEWDKIHWQEAESSALVIHALVIEPRLQGRGYGATLLRACEHLALENGYKSLRLDVFAGNPAAQGLYEKAGYHKCGLIQFQSKPAGYQDYACYEKILAVSNPILK